MNIIEKIKESLKNYPNIKYTCDNDSLVVEPEENGFQVGITMHNDQYTVSFEYWHEEFDNEEEAFNCFGFGLSSKCRLKICYKGSNPYKWIVEYKDNEKWTVDSTTGLFFFPYWKKTIIKTFQNNLLD